MSDEEKKAIEKCKKAIELDKLIRSNDNKALFRNILQTLLNLIEKQQKEIEELKNGQIDFWISDKEIE